MEDPRKDDCDDEFWCVKGGGVAAGSAGVEDEKLSSWDGEVFWCAV